LSFIVKFELLMSDFTKQNVQNHTIDVLFPLKCNNTTEDVFVQWTTIWLYSSCQQIRYLKLLNYKQLVIISVYKAYALPDTFVHQLTHSLLLVATCARLVYSVEWVWCKPQEHKKALNLIRTYLKKFEFLLLCRSRQTLTYQEGL